MLRKDAFMLYESLKKVRRYQDNSKFNYAIVKNMKLIEEHINLVEKIIEPTPEFIQLEMQRIPICEFYSKNAEGEVQMQNDTYIIQDEEKFSEAMKPLQEKYKDCLNHRQHQIDEYNRLIDEDVNFIFVKLGKNDLPQKITQQELLEIFPILE